MKKTLLILITAILIIQLSYAQEIVTPLCVNPAIKQKQEQALFRQKSLSSLTLPFMDDFSAGDIFPSPALWTDRCAFIDHNFFYYQPGIGVATLDAINGKGEIYPDASPYAFSADTLTSVSIRLDSVFFPVPKKILSSDSVYLSFWYQPGGGKGLPWERIGDVPEKGDSLFLEFYLRTDTTHTGIDTIKIEEKWKKVWSSPGMPLDTFYVRYGTYFRQVLVPVKDTAYLKNTFRFRFRNYASLANNIIPSWAGNVDQWHLDYIYLNVNRNNTDTAYNDLAFRQPAYSLLKTYQSMPWKQFLVSPASEMNNSPQVVFTNLSNDTRQANRNFRITDLTDRSQIYTSTGGNCNILPHTDSTFTPPFNYIFHSAAAKYADFEVMYAINTSPDINRDNDTIRFFQRFYNYFAYDDGSPENGYGLSPSGSMLAYAFQLNVADTLRAVDMFFNQTYENASQQYFYLTLWNDNNGVPGDIINQDLYIKPEFEAELNKFHTYIFAQPLVLSGKFYIGWEQTTSDNLNLGFDRNTNSQDKIFYNTDGTWYNSMYKGSLMIRPVFGSENYPHVGIDDVDNKLNVSLYPNPVSGGNVNLIVSSSLPVRPENMYVTIYDLAGKCIQTLPFSPQIGINNLNSGTYIVVIEDRQTRKSVIKKLTVIR